MDRKILGPSQDFYSNPYYTEFDRLLYRLQFKAYLKEVNDTIGWVERLQRSVLDD